MAGLRVASAAQVAALGFGQALGKRRDVAGTAHHARQFGQDDNADNGEPRHKPALATARVRNVLEALQ